MVDEPLAKPRPRIESLSDLIFGLALSIGAIALIGNPPTTIVGLFDDVLAFAFSFIILIAVWMRYTRIMSALPLETGRTMTLNILLLFCVSIEPFLFNILRSGNSQNPATAPLLEVSSSLYGLDLGVMILILGVFTLALADEEKRLVPKEMIRQFRRQAVVSLISGALFLVSAAPVFNSLIVDGTFLRTDMWVAAMVVVWVGRGTSRLLGRAAGQ